MCQHGAGRAMSRTAARKGKISDKAYAEMAELGVTLLSGDPKTVAEEVAFAYKGHRGGHCCVGVARPARPPADAARRRQGIAQPQFNGPPSLRVGGLLILRTDQSSARQSPSSAERSLSSISHAWSSVWKAECRMRNGSVHDRIRFAISPALYARIAAT
jgi:hypothetical protein